LSSSTAKNNLALIGMPACGKSTVGKLVADQLGYGFIDLDQAIELEAGRPLQAINEQEGFAGLRRREEAAALSLTCSKTVISPGGSIVYSSPAMSRLREMALIVYLQLPTELLEERVGDLAARGVIIRDGMSYADLVAERDPLYRAYADVTMEVGYRIADRVAKLIAGAYEEARSLQ
jgi:shikimate kinase